MNLSEALALIPRDAVVVVGPDKPEALAQDICRAGYSAVYMRDEHAVNQLSAIWSTASRRQPAAVVVSDNPAIKEAVDKIVMNAFINNTTSQRKTKHWVENLIRNAHHLEHHIGHYVERLNCPVIIAGSGPSLGKERDTIRRIYDEGSAVIIAINGACQAIPHHIAVCIENHDMRPKLGPLRDTLIRMFAIHCDPRVMDHGNGLLMPIYNGELSGWLEPVCGFKPLASCGSATVPAVDWALRMGADPVILIGQDLCFPDGRVYADGTGSEGDAVAEDGSTTWSETSRAVDRHGNDLPQKMPLDRCERWDGSEARSTPSMTAVASWLEVARRSFPGRRCFNASTTGRRMQWWAEESLGSLLGDLRRGSAAFLRESLDARIAVENYAQLDKRRTERLGPLRDFLLRVESDAKIASRLADALGNAAAQGGNVREAERKLLEHVEQAPLLEAWCNADVSEAMLLHRGTPREKVRYAEYRHSVETETELARRVSEAATELYCKARKKVSEMR